MFARLMPNAAAISMGFEPIVSPGTPTPGRIASVFGRRVPVRGPRGWPIRLLIVVTRRYALLARGAFARLDGRWKVTKSGMPKNYVVLAEKPVGG